MKYLYNHTTPDTAYIVHNYPYGYTTRTDIRYWIETVKGKGDRFASQTLNPKTGAWNAPKLSTYSAVMVMTLNEENDHISRVELWRAIEKDESTIANFLNEIGGSDKLNANQQNEIKVLLAYTRAYKNVTYTCTTSEHGAVSLLDRSPENIAKLNAIEQEQEARKKEQQKIQEQINRNVAHEYHAIENI